MDKKKVLLVFTNFSSFVARDYQILSSTYDVHQYRFNAIKGLAATAKEIIRQFLFLAFHVREYDAAYIWFADYHSLLPVLFTRIFNKNSFVVVGGYDVNYLPELNYGSFNRPIRKFFARNTLRNATLCFPVAEALGRRIRDIAPRAKVEVLATSTDTGKFVSGYAERPKSILTVATVANRQRAMIKGLDRFRELAAVMPDYKFTIIGVYDSFRAFFEPVPANLELLPGVAYEELPAYYRKASFYAQFSRSEGLPNSLCEAMLCGCIPLGTDVGDIADAVGESGMVTPGWNANAIADFVRKNHNKELLRQLSRNRIIEKYNPDIRRNRLQHLFNKVY